LQFGFVYFYRWIKIRKKIKTGYISVGHRGYRSNYVWRISSRHWEEKGTIAVLSTYVIIIPFDMR